MSAKNSRLDRASRVGATEQVDLGGGVCSSALAVVLSMGNTLRAYAAPGDLDPTFRWGWAVTTDFGGSQYALAVAIQSDGKVVAAGYAPVTSGDFSVARYNTDGSLDTTFNGTGKVTTDFFGGLDGARAVAIQSDGKIVVGGFANNGATAGFALARYNSDGSLDTSFNGNGKVFTDFGVTSVSSGLAIQSDGKIVAAGYVAQSGGLDDFAVARYNPNGSLDTSFSGDGKVTFDFGSDDFANAVAIQADGKIVVAGYTGQGIATDFALARLTTGGALDTGFSGDGKLTTDYFGLADYATGVAIQTNGKIVAAGYVDTASTGL